ncbi:hypothetical protein UCRPA7_1398 [Phaeoacremonium minimum UCRPA7]|uniref:Uncharacterized protein n=1 Tax=Phaeoacremonium minimum (strain UCR-PA7) TaxID=1286976 RepID=R8BUV3_PHAM7|nr:hypothetical protein UCRPA7_1398 [Phaeoacremonium minimum UCRPA7]EOO03090.1 hypothetical protein UCRPA7_1398 [Phaeoacremonium minimum UCRPA7]
MPHMRSSLGLAGTDALRRREALLVIATGEKGMTPEEWEKLVRRSAKAVAKDMAKDSDDDRFERVSAAYFHFQVDMMLWMRLLHSCVNEPPYSTEYKQALLWREEEAIDKEAPYAQREVDELLQQQEEQVKKYKAFMASKSPSGPGSHEKTLEEIDSSKASKKSIEEIYNEAFPPPSSGRWADELEDLDEAPDPLAYSRLFDKERPTEPGCDAFEVGIPRSWWGMVMGTHGTVISQAHKLVGCVRLAVIPLQENKPEGDLKLIAGLQGWVNDKSPNYWKALGDVWAGINKWVLTRRLGTEKRDLAAFLESWLKDGQSGISHQISDTRKDFQEEVKKKERLRLELTAQKAAAVAQVESDVAQFIVNKTDDECEQIVDAYFWNLDEPPDLCNYHEVIWEISAAWKKRVAAAGQKRAESWAWKTHRALKDG